MLAGSGKANLHVRGTSETGLAVDGDLPVVLDRGVISGHDLHLILPGQDVTSSGFTYDLQRGSGQLDFRLASQDVAPLGPILLGPPSAASPPPSGSPRRGAARRRGRSASPARTTRCSSVLDLQNVVAPVTAADTVRGALTLSPQAVDGLRIEMARNGGALLVTGRIPLAATGQKAATQPLNLAIDAAQWQAAGLAYFLDPLNPELTSSCRGSSPGASTSPASPTV